MARIPKSKSMCMICGIREAFEDTDDFVMQVTCNTCYTKMQEEDYEPDFDEWEDDDDFGDFDEDEHI